MLILIFAWLLIPIFIHYFVSFFSTQIYRYTYESYLVIIRPTFLLFCLHSDFTIRCVHRNIDIYFLFRSFSPFVRKLAPPPPTRILDIFFLRDTFLRFEKHEKWYECHRLPNVCAMSVLGRLSAASVAECALLRFFIFLNDNSFFVCQSQYWIRPRLSAGRTDRRGQIQ